MKKLILICFVLLVGCASEPKTDPRITEFLQWKKATSSQAQAGTVKFLDFYIEAYNRLSSLPKDDYVASDMRLLSQLIPLARKYDNKEISKADFEDQKRILSEQSNAALDAKEDEKNQAALRAYIANRANQPKPYQIPIPAKNETVNCTSNMMGQTVYTNCK
tara:strand:+ start:318 stop:803 length:486 start_codon:yes stop_codon:yes gene_type:complete